MPIASLVSSSNKGNTLPTHSFGERDRDHLAERLAGINGRMVARSLWRFLKRCMYFLAACALGGIVYSTTMVVPMRGDLSGWAEYAFVGGLAAVIGSSVPILLMGIAGGSRWWRIKLWAGWVPIALIFLHFHDMLIGSTIPPFQAFAFYLLPAFVLNAVFWLLVAYDV